jgi:hypothetical protein
MFRPRAYFSGGTLERADLTTPYPSTVGVQEKAPELLPTFEYAKLLVDEHERRKRQDTDYTHRYEQARDEVLPLLSLDVSEREGRAVVYPHFLARGIYQELRAAVGSPPPLPNTVEDPWGRTDKLFFRGSDTTLVANPFPASIIMFRYCADGRLAGVTSPTLNALESDSFRVAHERLLIQDSKYRQTFSIVIRRFEERVAEVSPYDLAAMSRLTHELRTALVEVGIDKLIEAAVGATSARVH